MSSFRCHPSFQIITVSHSGNVFLQDVLKGTTLCQVVTPNGYDLASPWEPTVVSAGNGQMLYLKGERFHHDIIHYHKNAFISAFTHNMPPPTLLVYSMLKRSEKGDYSYTCMSPHNVCNAVLTTFI